MRTLTIISRTIEAVAAPALVLGAVSTAYLLAPVDAPWGTKCELDWCQPAPGLVTGDDAALQHAADKINAQAGYTCSPDLLSTLPSHLYTEDVDDSTPAVIPFTQAALDAAPGNYWILEGCNVTSK